MYSSTCPGSNTTGGVRVTVCVGSDVAVDVGLNIAVEVTIGGAIVEEGTDFVEVSLTEERDRHPDNMNNITMNVNNGLFFISFSFGNGS